MQFDSGRSWHAREIARPACENAGLWDDAFRGEPFACGPPFSERSS